MIVKKFCWDIGLRDQDIVFINLYLLGIIHLVRTQNFPKN